MAHPMHGLWTSESVTEGHPDKLCDQISDAILDACLAQDPDSHVACETAAGKDLVMVFGEITTKADVNYERIAREAIREVGYTDAASGIDPDGCTFINRIIGQSPEIDHAAREGAGDQGMMTGFACDETESLMPMPIYLAHRLTERLAEVRRSGELPWLRPDGKSQVTVRYEQGRAAHVETVILAAQHDESVNEEQIAGPLYEAVIRPIIPEGLLDDGTACHVNTSGAFTVGGPAADAGLTGRKIIVDTYGGIARHGGGAFSGKDPSKVDRSAAYAARWVAKSLVAAGLARRIELQLAYAIGVDQPVSLHIEDFGTSERSPDELAEIVKANFDLGPASIIGELELKRPIYQRTAAHGHFGRPNLPWEQPKALRSPS